MESSTPLGDRQYAPATERNRDPILAVLKRVLPPSGTVLEISSGTGQHAAYFAPRLSPRHWLPSDYSTEALSSIEAWRHHQPADTLYPPIRLDAQAPTWPVEGSGAPQSSPITAIVNINMLHISPWTAGLGLLAGAGRILPLEGVLYLYGPFRVDDTLVPSNAAFDLTLRQRNPTWGVRDLEAVVAAAEAQGFVFTERVSMPANNLSLVFRKRELLTRCG
ncbi:MAG: DUF938 domain-containing protein [Elainellaceae cyanobacterium]